MIIDINIEDKRAAAVGAPTIVCGNSGYTIKFTFDDEWKLLSAKTARFVYVQDGKVKYIDVVFTGFTVAVPVMANTKEVQVGVFAGNLQTTTPARIPCEPSIRCGTGAPADPTPSQYDQIMELLKAGGGGTGGCTGTCEIPLEEKVLMYTLFKGANYKGDLDATVDRLAEVWGLNTSTDTTYTASFSISDGISISGNGSNIKAGDPFTLSLTAKEGYFLTSVRVTMGGENVTESAYANGVVYIASVTGDIQVSAVANPAADPTEIMSQFKHLGPTTYSPGTYTAWCPTGLIYDETRDVYAHFMNVRGSHYSTPDQIELWFNTIQPTSLEHSEPVFVAKGATSVGAGGGFLGCCIKNGVYYCFGDSVRGYCKSTNGGVTWTHHNYETGPDTNAWGCYVLSNGRMIMGTDAGVKVNYCFISDDDGANWTKIEANAVDTTYGAFDEPTFVEISEGVIMAIIRKEVAPSDPKARPYMRVSNDYGTTWSDAVEMQTVGFMNANNCNAFVHDDYVELFVGCRIPGTNSDYTGSMYTIKQYVLDRGKGAVDEFEFVNTVFDYKPETGLEDYGIFSASTNDFSTPCIAIKSKAEALLMFYAPTRMGFTHQLVAVGNVPVDGYSIPSIVPTSFKASETLATDNKTAGTAPTIVEHTGMVDNTLRTTVDGVHTWHYLKLDDIEDGGFIHLALFSAGLGDSFGTTWTVPPFASVKDGEIISCTNMSGLVRSPCPDGTTSLPFISAKKMARTLASGEILHHYAFIKDDVWWIYDDAGSWYRAYAGKCDISNITHKDYLNTFHTYPNATHSLVTYKAIGTTTGFMKIHTIEYDKIV